MNWEKIERWAESNIRYVGLVLVLVVGVMGVANAATI